MRAEIEIRGAGPVGCVLALLLSRNGNAVSVVGAAGGEKEKPFRPIALSYASRLILERVGAWARLSPTPIERIRVSQQGAFGRARLEARDAGVPALGYVVSYSDLLACLRSELEKKKVAFASHPGESLLAVHAEGVSDDTREKRYPHDAIVASVEAEPPATATAWERFTPDGPLALLPLGRRYGVVWAMNAEKAHALAAAPAPEFLGALQKAFGNQAGRFTLAANRAQLPLALSVRAARIGPRTAYVGNSAQALHPVAGQGLNLGLRDAWDLAQVLRDARDPGDERLLARYAVMRRVDAAATVHATDLLARGFIGAGPARRLIRGIALTALDTCLPARRFFARRMIYGASALP